MRLIHKQPFTPSEVETFRQLIFNNLTDGMTYILEAMIDMELSLPEEMVPYKLLLANKRDIGDQEPFPSDYYIPLKELWANSSIQKAWARGNEAALPEK